MTDVPSKLPVVRSLHDVADASGETLRDLVHLLCDAVDDGASVGFLAPLAADDAHHYWSARFREAAAGERVILAVSENGRIIGSVQLSLAAPQNGTHRAEVQRLIVLRRCRGRRLGWLLMRAVEDEATRHGRTLLLLNTRAEGYAERLYRKLGYREAGQVPGFAKNPDGSLNTTAIMYRDLTEPRAD